MKQYRLTVCGPPFEGDVLASRIDTTKGAVWWSIHDSVDKAKRSFEKREGTPDQLAVISEEDNGGRQAWQGRVKENGAADWWRVS